MGHSNLWGFVEEPQGQSPRELQELLIKLRVVQRKLRKARASQAKDMVDCDPVLLRGYIKDSEVFPVGTSLVVQLLRFRLPMQGTGV